MMDNPASSTELEREAYDLLAASELISRLSNYGQVLLTGSYRYHLMTVPDIDICLVSPSAGREQAKAIVGDLIEQGFWRGVSYEDFIQFPREDFPVGIYIGLKRLFRGRFWKVDLWCLTDAARDNDFQEAMARLTDEQRAAIMQIKQWRREANELWIPSKLIYDAVLQGRAHDVASFQRLLEEE